MGLMEPLGQNVTTDYWTSIMLSFGLDATENTKFKKKKKIPASG